jgi:1-aminocyclopropane-1-carboxylate deaminase/D-cysteine desulfhydrase-like pyridoxal-dependent ACC family enzyme
MSFDAAALRSPVQTLERLGAELGVELVVKRDDLLPFPLAGNKVRKLYAEARESGWTANDILITNGGVDSNHCRTLAMLAAQIGAQAHLVLHGEAGDRRRSAVRLLEALGATYDIVDSLEVAATIDRRQSEYVAEGESVKVIAGGAHTPAGVRSYVAAGEEALSLARPDHGVVASGTGATHAGLHIAAHGLAGIAVTGISVARPHERGRDAVVEAVSWVDVAAAPTVCFDARFVDGGYGRSSTLTTDVVSLAWRHGLPLDATYTGKAMRGLIELVREGRIGQGDRVLFWHTGGLMNHLVSI